MIQVSEAYKLACESTSRVSYIVAKFGLYDKSAKGSISSVGGNYQAFSNLDKTYNETRETAYNYISCEPNRVKLDGTFYFISDSTKPNTNENLAYWSSALSNTSGTFTSNPKIVYTFSKEIPFTELTLSFQEVCSEFVVRYYKNSTTIKETTITNNDKLEVQTINQVRTTEAFNKLEIEFVKTKEPNRYVKFNEVDFGIYQTFSKEQIVDIDIIDELSVDSSELSSNSLTLAVSDDYGEYDILNPNNKLSLLQEKQEITVYHMLKVGNSFKEVPLGTYLLKKFNQEKSRLKLQCYDDIYFMNDIYYGSKFYNNVEVKDILIDLFNYFNYTKYIIDSELIGIKLSGYLPNAKFRECLRLVAEASGCVVNKNREGITYIFKTYDDEVAKKFERKNLFTETPSKNLFNNVIDINEYDYSNTTPNSQLYRATLDVGQHIVVFNHYPVLQDTIVKSESNNNYEIISAYATTCVVNVTTKTEVNLKGTLINQTKTTRRIKKNQIIAYDEYAISKIDNTLITSKNLQGIAEWKLARNEVNFNFDTMVMPYIEVGDTCQYVTKYGETKTFVPTRLEFTKSIRQNIEGE